LPSHIFFSGLSKLPPSNGFLYQNSTRIHCITIKTSSFHYIYKNQRSLQLQGVVKLGKLSSQSTVTLLKLGTPCLVRTPAIDHLIHNSLLPAQYYVPDRSSYHP